MSALNSRRIPALRLAILLVCGILWGNFLPVLPQQFAPACLALLSLDCILLVLFVLRRIPRVLLTLLCALLWFFCGTMKVAIDRAGQRNVPDALLHDRAIVVGRILDPPTTVGRRTRFTLGVERVRGRGGEARVDECAAVMVAQSTRDSLPAGLEYGMRIALSGELDLPQDERNPGEFSTRRYYEANGITLALFVRGHGGVVILDSSGGAWVMRRLVVPARRYVEGAFERTIGGEEGEFLKGLVIGERSGMPVSTRQAFVNAGVAHVLAVSGSNVAVVATVLVFLCKLFRLPSWLRALSTGLGLLFYMLLAGSQPPVVRATVMAWVFLLGKVLQKSNSPYNVLGFSALLLLAVDARQLFDVGFQLSYGAVLSIIFFYPLMNRWIGARHPASRAGRLIMSVSRLAAVSVAATLGTLPLTAIAFGRISVVGILANIVVIPATGVSVVLGCVSSVAGLISPWLGSVYAAANGVILHWTLRLTDLAGGAPFAYIDTVRYRAVDALPYFALVSLLVTIGKPLLTRRLIIATVLAFDIAFYWPADVAIARTPGRLRVSVIDVGEGDAVLLEFPRGETMLIDCGPSSASGDVGERIVVPFLKRKGITSIDLLLVSHPHADHLGGARAVLRTMPVARVADCGQPEPTGVYAAYRAAAADRGATRIEAHAGQRLDVSEDVRLYLLAPEPQFVIRDATVGDLVLNNCSVVVRLVYGGVSFLFMGDAEREVEHSLLTRYGDFLKSDVLKIAHHGGSTGTSDRFLEVVQPSLGVISVGRNNMFRHPSASVLKRCASHDVPLARTDDDGAIVLETEGTEVHSILWR